MASVNFSGGTRGCIGKNLALTEFRVFAIKFFQRYKTIDGPAVKDKHFELQLTHHLKNNQAVMTKQ